MAALNVKIICGCVTVMVGVIAAVGVNDRGRVPPPAIPTAVIAPEVIHTSAWYLGHRDALKMDETRCVGDAANIAVPACKNVNEAIQEVDQSNVRNLLQQDLGSSK